jgi:F-type H+-transporting ATPase subunit epsilon
MRLRVLLPERILLDEEVVKVNAESQAGAFCLLPRHVDMVAVLAAGLVSFTQPGAEETFLAVDGGTLVKCGAVVTISTPRAIRNRPLGALQQALENELRQRDDHEQRAQAALGKIEADLVRQLVELSGAGH